MCCSHREERSKLLFVAERVLGEMIYTDQVLLMKIVLPLLLFVFSSLTISAQTAEIRLNQAGFLANDKKEAVILAKEPFSGEFVVTNTDTGKVVSERLQTRPLIASPWGGSFGYYYEVDLSTIKTPGTYRLVDKSSGLRSIDFVIGPYPAYHEDLLFFMRLARRG